MVAPNALAKLPWKKILQEAAKIAPYVYETIKVVLDERKKAKADIIEQNTSSIEDNIKIMEGGLKSVENNILSQADVIQKTQDEIGLIMSGLNQFHLRQNIVIGLSVGAIIMSVISLVAVLMK